MQAQIDFLNTGFGVSILISLPYKDTLYRIMIDGGDNKESIYQEDPRRIKSIDYLKSCDIDKIDLFILSHIHKDHIGGLGDIVRQEISIDTFIANMPVYTSPSEIGDLGDKYFDIPTQYIIYSLKEYANIADIIKKKNTELLVCSDTILQYSIGEYKLKIIPIDSKKLNTIYNHLHIASDHNKNDQERHKALRDFDIQLNSTTLAIVLELDGKNIFYSAGEQDVSQSHNLHTQGHVGIFHSPHHGDINYISKETLDIINPAEIVVCADSVGTYNLPSAKFEEIVSQYCNTNIYFTETKNSLYNVLSFMIDSVSSDIIYKEPNENESI